MRYYPICLDIQNRRCLVVGGGAVGTRKVGTLLDCGAEVTVVSPQVSPRIVQWAADKAVCLRQRSYLETDLDGMFLVIGATDDENLNRRIHADADARNMLCNIADRPSICNFILPSIVQRGDLMITISTGGKSPAFAKKLRRSVERQYGDEYSEFLRLMGAIRERLLAEAHAHEAHKPIFEALVNSDLIDMIRRGDTAQIDRLLEELLGREYRWQSLMKQSPSTDKSR